MNCPLCEDKGTVAVSKPVDGEVDGIEFEFTKAVPCPACLAGIRKGETVADRVRKLHAKRED